jgi:hypothetical protein
MKALVAVVILGLLLSGCRSIEVDCRDGKHRWSFDCGSPCEQTTIQTELAKCPSVKKDAEGFIGWRSIPPGIIQPMTEAEKRALIQGEKP